MYELLFYLVGHAAVVSTVFLLARYFRRQPNLKARREAIFELNHRPSRIEAGGTETALMRVKSRSTSSIWRTKMPWRVSMRMSSRSLCWASKRVVATSEQNDPQTD